LPFSQSDSAAVVFVQEHNMKKTACSFRWQIPLACCLGLVAAGGARADMYHPPATPGGLQAGPVIETVVPSGSNNAVLTFHGLQAPYRILVSPSLDFSNPSVAGSASLKYPNFTGTAVATNVPAGMAYFRLMMLGATNWVGQWNAGALSDSNVFVGASKCNGCHGNRVNEWLDTSHATAVSAILEPDGSFKPGRDESCLVCHTVGRNQPGGFDSLATTPQLAGVGCESCHGSGSSHVNISGRTYHPANTVASEVCGGCHQNPQGTTYEEWTTSGHAAVSPGVAGSMSDTPAGRDRMMRCGPCHSAAARMTMLNDLDMRHLGMTNALVMPTAHDAATYGVTCAVCHDPHSRINSHQLRNPLFSTNFFSLSVGSTSVSQYSTNVLGQITTNLLYFNTDFAAQYSAGVQICAQCHNQRGAAWTDTSRPPHHSPQYNLLIGDVGLPGGVSMMGAHGLRVTNQCTQCHVHGQEANPAFPVSETNTVYTGHSFRMTLNGCSVTGCHSSTNTAASMIAATSVDTTNRIAEVVRLLNTWATTKSPPALRLVYGQYAWEYTSPGQLSNPTGTNSITGPDAAGQALIPEAIRKARFNLYLVEHDASKGVHNADYARHLLHNAKTNVQAELNQ
jgi:hypothetical protein